MVIYYQHGHQLVPRQMLDCTIMKMQYGWNRWRQFVHPAHTTGHLYENRHDKNLVIDHLIRLDIHVQNATWEYTQPMIQHKEHRLLYVVLSFLWNAKTIHRHHPGTATNVLFSKPHQQPHHNGIVHLQAIPAILSQGQFHSPKSTRCTQTIRHLSPLFQQTLEPVYPVRLIAPAQ